MYRPATNIGEWVVVSYEPRSQRFNEGIVQNVIQGLKQAAASVGMVISACFASDVTYDTLLFAGVRIDRDPAVVKWLSGQGDIVQVCIPMSTL